MQAQDTRTATQNIFDDIAQRNADALLKHKDDVLSVQMTVSDLKRLLSDMNAGEMKAIIQAVASLHSEIVGIPEINMLFI